MDRIAARRLACDDPAAELLPDHAAGVAQYVLTHRQVPRAVLYADAADALRLVPLLRRQADEIDYSAIRLARASGLTWAKIATQRGMHSPQAAQQLYRRLAAAVAGEPRQVSLGRERSSDTARKPGQGGSRHRKVLMDGDLWDEFGELTALAGTGRSETLRELTRRWIRRQRHLLARETGAAHSSPATPPTGTPDVSWAERNQPEAEWVAAALAAIGLPDVAAESATAVTEVLHDPHAAAVDLPIWLRVLYKDLEAAGELGAVPTVVRERLSELARGWEQVTREPEPTATRKRAS